MRDIAVYVYNTTRETGTRRVPVDVLKRTDELNADRQFHLTQDSIAKPLLHIGYGDNGESVYLRATPATKHVSLGLTYRARAALEIVIVEKRLPVEEFDKARQLSEIAGALSSDHNKEWRAMAYALADHKLALVATVEKFRTGGGSDFVSTTPMRFEYFKYGPPTVGSYWAAKDESYFQVNLLDKKDLNGPIISAIHLEDFRRLHFDATVGLLSQLVASRPGFVAGKTVTEARALKPVRNCDTDLADVRHLL